MKELRLADILYAINNNMPTLPVGTRVAYDKTIDPVLTEAKSVQEFKAIVGQWYKLKHIFGEEYRDTYCIYEIADVLQLQYWAYTAY